jgi:hypothetical protein
MGLNLNLKNDVNFSKYTLMTLIRGPIVNHNLSVFKRDKSTALSFGKNILFEEIECLM